MADGLGQYTPKTTVDWRSREGFRQFHLWKSEVERILNGPLEDRSESVKVNHVYIWAGGQAEQLVKSRKKERPNTSDATVKGLMDILESFVTPITLFREAREEFYAAKQEPDENTDNYYTRVVDLFEKAKFPEEAQFLIVDRLVHGNRSKDCKRKLFRKGKDVTVQQCLDTMREEEALDVTFKHGDSVSVSAVSHDPSRRSQQKGFKKTGQRKGNTTTCGRCGRTAHKEGEQCPAKDKACRKCGKNGHFQSMCRTRNPQSSRRQQVLQIADEPSEDEDLSFVNSAVTVAAVHSEVPKSRFAEVKFFLHGKQIGTLEGKVDSAAHVCTLPAEWMSKIGLRKKDLQPSRMTIYGATGDTVKIVGTKLMDIELNGYKLRAKFYFGENVSEFLISEEVSYDSKCVSYGPAVFQQALNVDAVHITPESEVDYMSLQKKWKQHLPLGKKTGEPLKDLKKIFPDAFDGSVGLFPGEVELKLTSDAQPVQCPPRAVPQSIQDKLKKQLDKMEKEGVIRACPETTKWVHNLVIASKKDGSLRICLDPKNLNKYLVRNIHYTASWEDAVHSFQGGKFFSTLDAKSGYWTKKLSPESQKMTAFNTPFKKYCFIRMPFGLSVSSEIFQKDMDNALAGIPGTFPCADDVKVQGSSSFHHDVNLLETVERAAKAGIKFNPDKCSIKQREIEYFGRVVTPDGIEPCPKKIQAIKELQPPTSKKELQSFLGMTNFLGPFIPALTQRTHMMRGLLKDNVQYHWTSDMQKEFNNIKEMISKETQLVHFNPEKEVVIETDASEKGLGAVLLQEGRPVRFASKSLTPAEKNYSNIEREMLAVMYAVERFHNYTFGRQVKIHTDHEPLQHIFRKQISAAPPRLQRMLLRLTTYELDVKYVSAKHVLLADGLSRLIKPNKDKEIPGLDVSIASVMRVNATTLKILQDEVDSDDVLMQLKELIMKGWPESMQDVNQDVQQFWPFRDELTVLDGVVMKGNRIVVPTSRREEALKTLHDGHQGLQSTLHRARKTMYWPRMKEDIQQMIETCEPCQVHANKQPAIPERQIGATRPMEVLAMDLMEIKKGEAALVMIDYFSGYIMYDPLKSQTTTAVINALQVNFRKFGLPERILSDNGPCFKSAEFEDFCQQFKIQHNTSSPHYHQSNGRVERAIQTVKSKIKKTETKTELTNALLAYLDTPIDANLPSPGELFFNRRVNTRLGFVVKPPQLQDDDKEKLHKKRSAHLKTTSKTKEFMPGTPVWYTDPNSTEWKPGFVESKDETPDSYHISNADNSRMFRRNIRDIKQRFLWSMQQQPKSTPDFEEEPAVFHEPVVVPPATVPPPDAVNPVAAAPAAATPQKVGSPPKPTKSPVAEKPPAPEPPVQT